MRYLFFSAGSSQNGATGVTGCCNGGCNGGRPSTLSEGVENEEAMRENMSSLQEEVSTLKPSIDTHFTSIKAVLEVLQANVSDLQIKLDRLNYTQQRLGHGCCCPSSCSGSLCGSPPNPGDYPVTPYITENQRDMELVPRRQNSIREAEKGPRRQTSIRETDKGPRRQNSIRETDQGHMRPNSVHDKEQLSRRPNSIRETGSVRQRSIREPEHGPRRQNSIHDWEYLTRQNSSHNQEQGRTSQSNLHVTSQIEMASPNTSVACATVHHEYSRGVTRCGLQNTRIPGPDPHNKVPGHVQVDSYPPKMQTLKVDDPSSVTGHRSGDEPCFTDEPYHVTPRPTFTLEYNHKQLSLSNHSSLDKQHTLSHHSSLDKQNTLSNHSSLDVDNPVMNRSHDDTDDNTKSHVFTYSL